MASTNSLERSWRTSCGAGATADEAAACDSAGAARRVSGTASASAGAGGCTSSSGSGGGAMPGSSAKMASGDPN
eukprot:1836151-Alexandrium_andersonii.AAC.1